MTQQSDSYGELKRPPSRSMFFVGAGWNASMSSETRYTAGAVVEKLETLHTSRLETIEASMPDGKAFKRPMTTTVAISITFTIMSRRN